MAKSWMVNFLNSMNKIKYIVLLISILALSACTDELKKDVQFNAVIQNDLTLNEDGMYEAKVGTKVVFALETNADFVSSSYEIFNESMAQLSFLTTVNWADNQDNLHLYISTDFPGLSKNYDEDLALVHSHAWRDISSLCKWPASRNATDTTLIDMTEFKNQQVVLAFQYKTNYNSATQPMFVIHQLSIDSYVRKTGELIVSSPALSMGLQPFDAMTNDASAYESQQSAGKWDISFSDATDKTAIKIRQTNAGKALNEDWLISQPIAIPRGKVQNGSTYTIKNIHTSADSYSLVLSEEGEWTITFYAANENYKFSSNTEQTFKFIVK